MAKSTKIKNGPVASGGKAKAKGATPDVDVSKAAAKASEAKAVIPVLKPTAISADVGPSVLRNLAKASQDEAQGKELVKSASKLAQSNLALLTQAIHKAVKADSRLDLSPAFMEAGPGSRAKVELMNNQMYLALGVRTVVTGANGTQRMEWSDKVADLFPSSDDDDALKRAKTTFRQNLAHQMRKVAQTVAGLVDNDMTVKMDKAAGTLRIEGPAVKAQFGQDSVLLDEKQKVTLPPAKKGGEAREVELKARPSFAAMARRAVEERTGKVTVGRSSDRTLHAKNPADAAIDVCKSLTSILAKVNKSSQELKSALEGLATELDRVLDLDV